MDWRTSLLNVYPTCLGLALLAGDFLPSEATECLKNEDIGWRQGNMYSCPNSEAPECCEVKGQFTCCESGSVKHLREQIQLWGCVVLFCIVITCMYIYFKKDTQVFKRPTIQESWTSVREKFTRRKEVNIQPMKHRAAETDGHDKPVQTTEL